MTDPSRPTLADLKTLRDDEVFALVGLQSDARTPASWRPWQKPSPALPIDDAIAKLLSRTRHPRVPQGRRSMRLCPYFQGRFFAAWGAVNAKRDEVESNHTFKIRLVNLSTVVDRARRVREEFGILMKALHELSFSSSPAPAARLLCGSDRDGNYAAKDFLQAVHGDLDKALIEVSEVAASTSGKLDDQKKRDDYQVWHAAFAFRIGQLWFSLFEDVPGKQNNGPFVKLIKAAFETVCSDEGVDWNRAKTNAFERHEGSEPEDGFGRYVVLSTQPEGLSEADLSGARRKERQRIAERHRAAAEEEEELMKQVAARLKSGQKGTLN